MSHVHSENTSLELAVRSLAKQIGYKFTAHRHDLPGSPDIVFERKKIAVFAHGCWWHGHHCRRGVRKPKTNVAYWATKISKNRTRDKRVRRQLAKLGWKSVVIWECHVGKPTTLNKLHNILKSSHKARVPR